MTKCARKVTSFAIKASSAFGKDTNGTPEHDVKLCTIPRYRYVGLLSIGAALRGIQS